MDRAKFFAGLRGSALYKTLPQSAVTTLDLILNHTDGKGIPVEHTAYMMATSYHEVGPNLIPVRENLNYSTAARIRKVWPSRFKNDAAAAPYVSNPQKLANFVYGGRLGNTGPNDGWLYRGGGLPQATGKDNFGKIRDRTGIDVVSDPDKIVLPEVASAALVEAMRAGIYTGKKLSDYKLPAEYKQARAIINSDVAANGEKIAGYARAFEKALREAGYRVTAQPAPAPAPQPLPPQPSNPEARAFIASMRAQLDAFEASLK